MVIEKKQCSGCYETKDIKGFSINKMSEDGFQNYCKECNKAYQKERHFIKNNPWQLYRVTIDIRDIVGHGRRSYYIGITQKDLKDRLNEHISAIKNKRHKNFWIMEMFKYFPYSQIENINLRDYIKIELLKEYSSTYTKSEMKKFEKKAIYEQAKHCLEVDEWTTDTLNLEHLYSNAKWAKDIRSKLPDGKIKFEERHNLYKESEEIHVDLIKTLCQEVM